MITFNFRSIRRFLEGIPDYTGSTGTVRFQGECHPTNTVNALNGDKPAYNLR